MLLLVLCTLSVTLPLQLSCNCPSSVQLYSSTESVLVCSLLAASKPAWQDARMDAHAPHLSAAAVDQPTSVSVWEQPAVSSRGRTNRLSQIPTEGGADFGLIRLLVRLWSPGALKIVHTGPYFCVCTLAKSNRRTTNKEKT